jgi:hypothetical protein
MFNHEQEGEVMDNVTTVWTSHLLVDTALGNSGARLKGFWANTTQVTVAS